jgi:hypothetical protein
MAPNLSTSPRAERRGLKLSITITPIKTRAPTRGVGDVDIIGYVMLMPLRQRTKILPTPKVSVIATPSCLRRAR